MDAGHQSRQKRFQIPVGYQVAILPELDGMKEVREQSDKVEVHRVKQKLWLQQEAIY